MPYTTEVIDNGKGVLHTGSRTVTGQDLIASAATLLQQIKNGLRPEYGFTDLSGVTDFTVTSGEIERNADLNKEIARLCPSVRVAIVASADVVYGMARKWQAHVDESGWTSMVFRTKEEAAEWLKQGR